MKAQDQEILDRRRKMAAVVDSMQEYVATYDRQVGYTDYSDEIFIDDMLYGIGIALDRDKYSFADGYRSFKEELLKHLNKDNSENTN